MRSGKILLARSCFILRSSSICFCHFASKFNFGVGCSVFSERTDVPLNFFIIRHMRYLWDFCVFHALAHFIMSTFIRIYTLLTVT
uniref:Uncharacterized protein n=1 Tax=Anopheles darlingi TaxID=43151 RepID=A0A2M4DCH2_ANODA